MILQQTIDLLKSKYANYIQNLTITDVRLGLFMTGIKLSDNSYGMSSTFPNIHMSCYKQDRDFGEYTPNRIAGLKVIDLLESDKQNGIVETLKVAALNAISSRFLHEQNYKIIPNADPIDLLDLNSGKTISIVGAFHSYIQKIAQTNSKMHVLELDENAIMEKDRKYFVPAEQYSTVLPYSHIVLITGLTLVNNTLDDLLKAIRPDAQIIVSGPSSSFIPDILFAKGVNIIGSVKITNPEVMFKVVSEGGSGYHTFKYCAEKICIVNE